MATAPAMTLEAARHGFERVANEQTDPVGALLYALFALGWLASMIGLRQLRATGSSRIGRALLGVTILTIMLAVLQSPMSLLPIATRHPLYCGILIPLALVFMAFGVDMFSLIPYMFDVTP